MPYRDTDPHCMAFFGGIFLQIWGVGVVTVVFREEFAGPENQEALKGDISKGSSENGFRSESCARHVNSLQCSL